MLKTVSYHNKVEIKNFFTKIRPTEHWLHCPHLYSLTFVHQQLRALHKWYRRYQPPPPHHNTNGVGCNQPFSTNYKEHRCLVQGFGSLKTNCMCMYLRMGAWKWYRILIINLTRLRRLWEWDWILSMILFQTKNSQVQNKENKKWKRFYWHNDSCYYHFNMTTQWVIIHVFKKSWVSISNIGNTLILVNGHQGLTLHWNKLDIGICHASLRFLITIVYKYGSSR